MDLFDAATTDTTQQARVEGDAPAVESALTREQLVDRILHINPSATARFLDRFAERPLRQYYEHLLCAAAPRGERSRWVRPGDTPAIVGRESED